MRDFRAVTGSLNPEKHHTGFFFFQAGIKLFIINAFSATGKREQWASPTVDLTANVS